MSKHHVRGHYPSFITHTGSCARAKPSHRLRFNYYDGSLQVAARPCWEMALPDIISAILAEVPGPLPRSVLPVHMPASSRKATASPQASQVRHTKILPVMHLQQGSAFRGCSHSIMFKLPRSLDPQIAPTAEAQSLQGGRAVYTTHSSVSYLLRDVVSLRIRHGHLIRLDFHQLDCSLVGRSDARAEIVIFFAPAALRGITLWYCYT
jgi:hypothetical protein